MPSSLLLRAGIRYQLRHRWQLLLALTGIAMGVAVVLAVDLANSAARASFALSSEQLRGAATHRIVGNTGRVPQDLYPRLFRSPGHPPMAPVISTRVRSPGIDGRITLVGLDLFAERGFRDELAGLVSGVSGLSDWLTRDDAVALSASAAALLEVESGQEIVLEYQGKAHRLQVALIGDDQKLSTRHMLMVDIATAQSIAGMQRGLTHIDLILDAEAQQWLAARLPPSVRLVDVAEQARNTAGLSAAFELNLTAMSLLALMVGVFLIYNAIRFSVVQRRSLLGRLRALGVRSDELSRLVLLEALVLALLGTLIGLLLGYLLGQGLTQIVAATVSELYYDVSADAMQLNLPVMLKAIGLGLLCTLVAAWLPARQAAGTPPLTTLSRSVEESVSRSRIPFLAGLGVSLCVVGYLVAVFLPGGIFAGFAGLFLLLLGAALMTPMALRLAHALLRRLPLRGVWRMGIRDIDRHLSRLGTAAAALTIALAASVGVAVMVDSMRGSVSDWLLDLLAADLYIANEGYDDGATLPQGIISTARALSPAIAMSSYRSRKLQVDGRRVSLSAAELATQSRAGFEMVAGDPAQAWSEFDSGAVLVSEPLARRARLRPGDRLQLPTDDAARDFLVAGVFRDFASEHGRIFIDRGHYESYWQDRETDNVALFAAHGQRGALLQAARAAFSESHPDLVYTVAGEIYDESMAVFDKTFRITEVLRLLSVIVALIGVFSALMAMQLERRKEYAVLRALGLTRTQVSQLIVLESAFLGLLTALLAVPTGLMAAWVLTNVIQLRAFGWSMSFIVEAGPLLFTIGLGLFAAILASLYPAWRSAQQDPAPQLRED